MRSIGSRIAVWFACAASLTLALMFVAGYWLLKRQLVEGLDQLNQTEFRHIESRLMPDYPHLTQQLVTTRIREAADVASTLFYIDIHQRGKAPLFRSANLMDRPMRHTVQQESEGFSPQVGAMGPVRAREFRMGDFDVLVATPLEPVNHALITYIQIGSALMVVVVLVSVLIGLLLSRLLLAPVRAIREVASHIGCDKLTARIPVSDVRDDISELSRLLNQMFDRLEKSFGQIQRFTSDASHELKTPLSVIRLHAERMLADETLAEQHREGLQDQLEEIERLHRIIEDLLLLSRADAHAIALDLQQRDPVAVLEEFLPDAQVLAEHHGMHFDLIQHKVGPVVMDAKWMRQVWLNLLLNAIHASPPLGVITLQSARVGHSWRLTMEDDGKGLTVEQCEHVFERFVRYNTSIGPARPGSGLGLAICHSIVNLHGGHISARPGDAGRGLCVTIELPLSH